MLAIKANSKSRIDGSANDHRLLNADCLKAVSIFAVVYIHGSSTIPFVRSANIDAVSTLFRFCVPMFILLWAFFLEKSIGKRENRIHYLTSRFYRMLIPFLFWSTIYFILLADWPNLTPVKIVTTHWLGRGWSGQYYFIILFQLLPVFMAVRYISLRYITYPLAVVLISMLFYGIISYSPLFSVSLIKKIGDAFFIYWLPYVVLGILYANRGIPSSLTLPVLLGIIGLFAIPIEFYFCYPRTKPYLTSTVFFSSVLLFGSVMRSRLAFLQAYPLLIYFIQILGKNTLGIFCLNPLVIISISSMVKFSNKTLNFWGCSTIVPLVSTSLIILICLSLIYLLKRIKLGMVVTS